MRLDEFCAAGPQSLSAPLSQRCGGRRPCRPTPGLGRVASAAAVDGVGVGVGPCGEVREHRIALLDLVAGRVCAVQDPACTLVGQVGGPGDADQRIQLQGETVKVERSLQLVTQRRDLCEFGRDCQHGAHGELVAEQPGGGCSATRGPVVHASAFLAAWQSGQPIAAGSLQLAAEADVVGGGRPEDGARDDDECAGTLP